MKTGTYANAECLFLFSRYENNKKLRMPGRLPVTVASGALNCELRQSYGPVLARRPGR